MDRFSVQSVAAHGHWTVLHGVSAGAHAQSVTHLPPLRTTLGVRESLDAAKGPVGWSSSSDASLQRSGEPSASGFGAATCFTAGGGGFDFRDRAAAEGARSAGLPLPGRGV